MLPLHLDTCRASISVPCEACKDSLQVDDSSKVVLSMGVFPCSPSHSLGSLRLSRYSLGAVAHLQSVVLSQGQIMPGCLLLRLKPTQVSASPFSLGLHPRLLPLLVKVLRWLVVEFLQWFVVEFLLPFHPAPGFLVGGWAVAPCLAWRGAPLSAQLSISYCAAAICGIPRGLCPCIGTAFSLGHFFAQWC